MSEPSTLHRSVLAVVNLDDTRRVGGGLGPLCDVRVAESLCTLLAARRPATAAVDASKPNVVHFQSRRAWTRDARDQLRRCLDRAAQRVYPPLDAAWYAHPNNLVFADDTPAHVATSSGVHNAFFSLPLTMDLAETVFSVEGACFGGDAVRRWKVPRVIREVAQSIGCEWLSALPSAEGGSAWDDVMQHAMMKACTRTPHVEPRGILVTGCVVAHTPYHALVAVPCGKMTPSGMVVVGRIPMPRCLAQQTDARGQKRERDTAFSSTNDMSVFGELAVVFAKTSGRKAPPMALPEAQWLQVDVIAFRVFASRSRSVEAGTSTMPRSIIEIDDCYVLSRVDDTRDVSTEALRASTVHSYRDVCEMVQNSCRDALRLHNKATGMQPKPSKEAGDALTVATTRVRSGMLETAKVQFGKDRKAFRDVQRSLSDRHPLAANGSSSAVPPALTAGAVVEAEETSLVEFKGRIADWVDEDAAQGTTRGNASAMERQSASNRERLRHTICAMANTFGGYLVVGLEDDGRVAGIDAAAADIRISGFCPPMFNGSIVLNKHRVVESGGAVCSPSASGGERRGLPDGWWKATPTAAVRTGPQAAAAPPKVVSVVQVLRGTAPFYAPARYATPSMRGAASTMRMPVYICCIRLATHLPLTNEVDNLLSNHAALSAPTKSNSADAWSS